MRLVIKDVVVELCKRILKVGMARDGEFRKCAKRFGGWSVEISAFYFPKPSFSHFQKYNLNKYLATR